MEYHPRINVTDKKLNEQRIILGSFPTWALTLPDVDKGENVEEKELERIKNKDINYFYGSSINQFWNWYKEFLDHKISKENISSIDASLKSNKIGITDVIFSCERNNRSGLDKHLTNRTYNQSFFRYPAKGETIKILCTSKGVMNEMLLNKNFFALHPLLSIDYALSDNYQAELIKKINGNLNSVRNPFYKIMTCESGGTIECMAIPSPGSPYRRLMDFGIKDQSPQIYLSNYLKEAFSWFTV